MDQKYFDTYINKVGEAADFVESSEALKKCYDEECSKVLDEPWD